MQVDLLMLVPDSHRTFEQSQGMQTGVHIDYTLLNLVFAYRNERKGSHLYLYSPPSFQATVKIFQI